MSGWEHAAQQKRQELLDLIPDKWKIDESKKPTITSPPDTTIRIVREHLDDREKEITESTALSILEHTLSGQWKARDVAEAFCHRAALAHQLISCLHEIFFDAAIKDAEAADEHFTATGEPVGPLHGLPISLKDQFHVKGVETTMGYVGWMGTFQGEKGTGKDKVYESELVRELRELGATLYCKTSCPHTLMCGETINNIIGYTPNPRDLRLAVGGSSGGEGGLIALKGSPLGFGTDIGGSVRIPAAFNGLWGLKPSTGRLPYHGAANSMDGQTGILSAVGPIASSLGDIRLAMKALLMTEPWFHDPGVVPMPWKDHIRAEVLSSEKLVFGILSSDGLVNPLPPMQRAFVIVGQALQRAGHEIVDWKPPSHEALIANVSKHYKSDGGCDVHKAFALSGEPVAAQVRTFVGAQAGPPHTASELMAYNVETRALRHEYAAYWNGTAASTSTGRPVDAFLACVAPFPAAPRNTYTSYSYSIPINCLDYSACVIPVTTADKQLDVVEEGYTPLNETDAQTWAAYDPELFDGHPVCLQLVGRRLQEERVLALAEVVEAALAAASQGV